MYDTHAFAVLADDLTGAAEATVALARADEESVVFLTPRVAAWPGHPRVSGFDLHTRGLPADEACEVLRAVGEEMSSRPVRLFKKIDSTLRGHVGAELAALCEGLCHPLCIVAPALPSQGRTLVGGHLLINGLPAADARLWGDGVAPQAVSLATTLAQHGFMCSSITLPDLRMRDDDGLAAIMNAQASAGATAIVCDAQTDDDLRRIASASLMLSGVDKIWVGSAGLAHGLCASLPGAGCAPLANSALPMHDGSVVFVSGSFSQPARAQMRLLARQRDVVAVGLSLHELKNGLGVGSHSRIEQALAAKRDVAIHPDLDMAVDPAMAACVATGLAHALSGLHGQIGTLVGCGGDTSRALLDSLHATHIHVRGYGIAGVTLAHCGAISSPRLVLKAGAFGDDALLARLRNQLRIDACTSQDNLSYRENIQ